MTTIEYGGGPSVDQRRAFAGLKDGSMVPGYCGYCPHLKFCKGKTYGETTFDLSQTNYPKLPTSSSFHNRPVVTKLHPDDSIPESNGDNKYTKNMVPGYTGYIPRWPFKFGNTYREECDVCLNEHFGNVSKQATTEAETRKSFRSFPNLQPIRQDPEVKDRLNTFSDRLSGSNLKGDKRASTEPPMPGYRGFVPRIYTTELGLGCRYHDMTRNGLDSFYGNLKRRGLNGRSVTFADDTLIPKCNCNPKLSASSTDLADSAKRLYKQDGMIPKYTGYLPQKMFSCGYTYGDTARSLDVCAHDRECYGDYVKTIRHLPYIA